jgi:hypothetical protein
MSPLWDDVRCERERLADGLQSKRLVEVVVDCVQHNYKCRISYISQQSTLIKSFPIWKEGGSEKTVVQ